MCATVEVNGKICSCQGDLSSALGGDLCMEYGAQDCVICLCPVNLKTTAARYGFRLEKDGDTPFNAFKMTADTKEA